MKKYIAIAAVALSSIMIACNEKKEYGDVTDDGVMEVDEATSSEESRKAGADSSMRLTDGSRIPVIIQPTDSITLPDQLLTVIEKTSEIHPDSIMVKRRFKENNITYYELEFRMNNGEKQTFIFDEEGKRKSEDE